jgi:hypothetical protein
MKGGFKKTNSGSKPQVALLVASGRPLSAGSISVQMAPDDTTVRRT